MTSQGLPSGDKTEVNGSRLLAPISPKKYIVLKELPLKKLFIIL